MYTTSDILKIEEAVKDSVFPKIALSNKKGNLTGWNNTKTDRITFFSEIIKPYLLSTATPGGIYTIIGKTRNARNNQNFQICSVSKEGVEDDFSPLIEKPVEKEVGGNIMIVRESERLKTKQEYQLQELDRLQKLVQEQANTILNLEEEIEELEEQIELLTTQQKTLSEAPMNTFLQVATPLLQQGGALLMHKALEHFGMIPKQEQQTQVMAPPVDTNQAEPIQTIWGIPVSEVTQLPINGNQVNQN
jgi:hypothetical protein